MRYAGRILFFVMMFFGCLFAAGIEGKALYCGPYIATYEDYDYYFDEHAGGARIVAYHGNDESVIIPEQLENFPVKAIGYGVFENNNNVTSVHIPASVQLIKGGAFAESGIRTITVASDSTYFYVSGNCIVNIEGTQVVAGCDASVIPPGITSIGEEAFKGSAGLTAVTIPEGVTSIGDHAFYGCNLSAIEIPKDVTTIGIGAFRGNSINRITVALDNEVYYVSGNCLIESSTKQVIFGCGFPVIPTDVESIGEEAFADCMMTTITVPESVTSIGRKAFEGCSGIHEITIPSGVTAINYRTFFGTGLTAIEIPAGVTSISGTAFGGNNLVRMTVSPDNETYYVNGNCIIEKATQTLIAGCNASVIPSDVKKIGSDAFYGCGSLKVIDIPANVESVGFDAFAYCRSLNNVSITSHTSILDEDGLFTECADDLTVYGESGVDYSMLFLFTDAERGYLLPDLKCKVKILSEDTANPTVVYMGTTDIDAKVIQIPDTVTIGDVEYMVTDIGKDAFSSCTSLEEVVLPASLEHIDSEAFAGVTDMDGDQSFKITVPEDLEDISNVGIENITNIQYITIYVAEGSQAAIYLQQTGNTNIVTYMGQYSGTEDKKEENVPEQSQQTVTPETKPQVGEIYAVNSLNYKVTSSKYVTFTGASKKTIRTITIPAKVTILGQSFQVTAIEKKALKKYTRLTTVVIGSNVKTIGNEAFMNCRNLNKITIGKNVKTIGKKAFYGDRNLTRIIFKGSKVTKVDKKTLHNVPKKVKITAPKKAMNKYKKLLNAAK